MCFSFVQGEAQSAVLIGKAMQNNPAFTEIRRIEAAREIAHAVANSPNRVYLNSDQLLMNLTSDFTLRGKTGAVTEEAAVAATQVAI
jgi:hypothetical protein